MQKLIYVTEPNVIDLHEVKRFLPSGYEVVPGDTYFSGESLEECTVLMIRSATTITSSIKDIFPNLTDIVRVGTGVDNIDVEFCNQEGISVYNAPGANADAVSDYIVCMMLVALRKIHTLTSEDVKAWNRFKFTGHSMSAQSIGIIGFGNIGKQIHRKLQGFGCKDFFVYDPFIKKEDLPESVTYMPSVDAVLRKSSIVTLHVPLLPETHNLINKRNLPLLGKGSILLNASRGGIVNETDATEAVHSGELVYVADTVEGEPHVAPRLLEESNVIITPHIASLTEESEDNMVKVAVKNFLNQSPMNRPKAVLEAAVRL